MSDMQCFMAFALILSGLFLWFVGSSIQEDTDNRRQREIDRMWQSFESDMDWWEAYLEHRDAEEREQAVKYDGQMFGRN